MKRFFWTVLIIVALLTIYRCGTDGSQSSTTSSSSSGTHAIIYRIKAEGEFSITYNGAMVIPLKFLT